MVVGRSVLPAAVAGRDAAGLAGRHALRAAGLHGGALLLGAYLVVGRLLGLPRASPPNPSAAVQIGRPLAHSLTVALVPRLSVLRYDRESTSTASRRSSQPWIACESDRHRRGNSVVRFGQVRS